MLEHSLILKLSSSGLADNTTSRLRQEYQAYQRLFQAQTESDRQFLSNQAASLADALIAGVTPISFRMPDHVVCLPMMDCIGVDASIPYRARQQRVGNLLDRLSHPNPVVGLGKRLDELEKSADEAISVAAGLIRHALVIHMVQHMLPEGRSVTYISPEDDDIPNQPTLKIRDSVSDRASLNAYHGRENDSIDGVESINPDKSYASGFFLPKYVAINEQNQLLVGDLQGAITDVETLQQYSVILDAVVNIAPYMVVNEEFQVKRYGILGQLVNQGRALANYQVEILCQTIKKRAASHSLDRGLSLSLPYFNDQTLKVEKYTFDIIPSGLVMFVPAFVVLAVREEAKRILQNTRLSQPTRKALLKELCIIERAFLR